MISGEKKALEPVTGLLPSSVISMDSRPHLQIATQTGSTHIQVGSGGQGAGMSGSLVWVIALRGNIISWGPSAWPKDANSGYSFSYPSRDGCKKFPAMPFFTGANISKT